MNDRKIDLPSFFHSFAKTEVRPYLFLAGLQAVVSFLGALLITTGLLG